MSTDSGWVLSGTIELLWGGWGLSICVGWLISGVLTVGLKVNGGIIFWETELISVGNGVIFEKSCWLGFGDMKLSGDDIGFENMSWGWNGWLVSWGVLVSNLFWLSFDIMGLIDEEEDAGFGELVFWLGLEELFRMIWYKIWLMGGGLAGWVESILFAGVVGFCFWLVSVL